MLDHVKQIRRGLGSQVFYPYPGKDQKLCVVDHQRQVLLALLVVPADPPVAALQGVDREGKQQASEQPLSLGIPADDEIAQVIADGTPVAHIVVTVDVFVEAHDRIRFGDRFNGDGGEPAEGHCSLVPNNLKNENRLCPCWN